MKYGLSLALAVLWLTLGPAPASGQNFDKGLAAARAGDFATAIAQWRPLASNGNAEAQFNLGVIYETGLGVPPDAAEAVGWYALAAGQGHAKAQYNLGVMYADGRGVPHDDARAATWLRKAAEQGHGKAQYNLAVLYRTGRGVPKDPERARVWFERAAANGVAPPDHRNRDRQSAGAPVETAPAGAPRSDRAADNHSREEQTARIEPVIPAADGKILEPADTPLAVRSIGLNLHGLGLDEPAEPPAAAPEKGPAVAALPTGSLRITARLPAGARYRLEVTETRQRTHEGNLVMAQTSLMDVDMVVKPGADGGALIEWTFGPATVKTAGDPRAGRLASELGKLIDGQTIAYRTNGRGEVTALGNPRELASFYQKSVARVLSAFDAEAADPQLAELIRGNLTPLLSDDHAAAHALDMPKLLHFFSGLELVPGETYSRDSVMRLPPSADALPGRLDYELKWFDRAANVAWLRWRQSVDPERAAGALRAYIESLAARSGRAAPAELALGAIDVSDSADYEIDLATGFPRQVIYTRTVELFGYTQIEKRRIRVTR